MRVEMRIKNPKNCNARDIFVLIKFKKSDIKNEAIKVPIQIKN